MTRPTRTQAENSLAALIHAIRPDWPTPTIRTQLRAEPNTPLEVLAAAALWATSRRDQHDPKVIREDDGNAWDRITGRQHEVAPGTPADRLADNAPAPSRTAGRRLCGVCARPEAECQAIAAKGPDPHVFALPTPAMPRRVRP